MVALSLSTARNRLRGSSVDDGKVGLRIEVIRKEGVRLTASACRRGGSLGLLGLGVLGPGLLDQLLLAGVLSLRGRLSLRRRDRSLMVDAVEGAQAEGRVAEHLYNPR